MPRSRIIDLQTKRPSPAERFLHFLLVNPHGRFIIQTIPRRFVLCLAEATIVMTIEDLNLLATGAVGAQDIKIGVPGDAVKLFQILFFVTYGAAGAQI